LEVQWFFKFGGSGVVLFLLEVQWFFKFGGSGVVEIGNGFKDFVVDVPAVILPCLA